MPHHSYEPPVTTPQQFSSRLAMMLTMLGMAVGTGNIWRFPRIASQNGGGEFLVSWIVFLFIWSIPLILVEFGMGRLTRMGPVGAFVKVMGPKYAWMGAFIAWVATAIMFYYAVVCGWTLHYLWAALTGAVPGREPGAYWQAYTGSYWPLLTHAVSIGLAAFVVARGVRGIERAARILMPVLIILVLVLTVRAVTLPGAGAGLAYQRSDLAAGAHPECVGHRRGLGTDPRVRSLPAPARGHCPQRVHSPGGEQHHLAAGRHDGDVHGVRRRAAAGRHAGDEPQRARRVPAAGRGRARRKP
jgi:hypothetical protein